MNKEFNIRHALLIALGLNKNCRNIINEIYQKNESEYYRIYRKSDFYDDLLKNIFSIETIEAINKLIGIIEKSYQTENFSNVEKLIRKVHPSIINFVKNNTKRRVNLTEFSHKYLVKDIDKYSELDLFTILVCLMYTAKIKNEECEGYSGIEMVFEYWNKLLETLYLYNKRSKNIQVSKKFDSYYNMFGLESRKCFNNITIGKFLDDMIDNEAVNRVQELTNEQDRYNIDLTLYHKVRNNLFKEEGIYKYLGSFSAWYSILGIEQMDAESYVNIDNNIIDLVIDEFERAKECNDVSEDKKEIYIIACLNMYVLAELYHKAKELYLNKSKEDKFNELEKMEEKLAIKEANLINKEIKLKEKINKLTVEISNLKLQEKSLIRDNKKLTADNNRYLEEFANKDVQINKLVCDNNQLLNIIKRLEDSMRYTEISLEDMIDNIKGLRIAIVGGKKGIDRLSQYIPDIIYCNEINKDISLLKNMEYIFINTDFFNHSFMYKIESLNIKYDYIGGTNIDLIIKQIYNSIKN